MFHAPQYISLFPGSISEATQHHSQGSWSSLGEPGHRDRETADYARHGITGTRSARNRRIAAKSEPWCSKGFVGFPDKRTLWWRSQALSDLGIKAGQSSSQEECCEVGSSNTQMQSPMLCLNGSPERPIQISFASTDHAFTYIPEHNTENALSKLPILTPKWHLFRDSDHSSYLLALQKYTLWVYAFMMRFIR